MPSRGREKLRTPDDQTWEIEELGSGPVMRGATLPAKDDFLDRLQETGRLSVVDRKQVRSMPRRGLPAAVPLEMDGAPGEAYVLMARHESGAITFHVPEQLEHRSTRGKPVSTTVRFSVPVHDTIAPEQATRGIVGKVIHATVMKVVGVVAGKAMPVLARLFEAGAWKLKGLEEGWKLVSPATLQAKVLPTVKIADKVATGGQRNLLFIHGTFSNAHSGIAGLATARGSDGRTFFEALGPIYGDRIFAFDHFTVSRTLVENAKALLTELPSGPSLFDVVTHSRGGLVLRTLVEESAALGGLASRFQLGRAVLVASPNGGTPLATPSRFNHFLDWLGNILDLFPQTNPFVIGAEFVSEALAWLAHGVGVDIPGLAAMNQEGPVVKDLQSPPGPPSGAYSALVANFEPDQTILQRMVDAGVDTFFGTANDLVVPTEGGWRVDPGGTPVISSSQIGCFGRGGNVQNPPDGQVTHISFFSRTATVDFLVRGLQGKPQGLAALDPDIQLPFRSRRGAAVASTALVAQQPQPATSARMAAAVPPVNVELSLAKPAGPSRNDVFYLSVLEPPVKSSKEQPEVITLLANFRNARVMERIPIHVRGGDAGQRFHNIIEWQRSMRDFLNGEPGVKDLPNGEQLIKLGIDLFETLFPGQIRRLYDAARAAQPDGRLDLVFTSMISWLADLPWEFAYDPERENFLATAELNFTRNVRTAIPADLVTQKEDRLRILVVVAQPLGLAHLSVDEEIDVIKSGFKRLMDADLAVVDVLLDATPALLHQMLEVAEPYDVVHFIGHGEYDSEAKIGYLAFENEEEGLQKMDSQILQQILCRRGVRLVFLNACETGKGGSADFNRGVAPALVAAGVPAVVANQFSVLDVSATAFARHFYWALAQGQTIGDAAREARVAVNYSISGQAIDWAVPVVFARNPGDRLASIKASAGQEVAAVQKKRVETSRAQRRSMTIRDQSKTVIGLWDVHRLIPHLDQIAATLTAAQDGYIFKAVSIPAPLGTWRREKSEGLAYLHAEKVVDRLRDKPLEFGLDQLLAITNLPLRDKDTLGLYFWDEDPQGKIAILSTYGFLDKIQPPLSIERMVANMVAGLVGGVPEHMEAEKGEKNCPFFYNNEVDVEYIAGPLQVCDECLKKFKKLKLPPERLQTVQKLLAVYP